MKKTFTFLMTTLTIGSIGLFGQVFSDDFSSAHDYLSDGVAGTIWDGLKENDGNLEVAEVAEIVVLNTNDEAGALSFTTVNSHFSAANDNGAMLYKNVAADTDFDLRVEIYEGTFPSYGDTVGYLMVGPIARVDHSDSVKFVALQAFDRPEWGAVYGFRNINMDPEENWVTTDGDENPVSIGSHPFMRLERVGSTYTGYISEDGEDWYAYWSEDRPDMDGYPLQVGLYNATYTDQEGTVIFDNFSLSVALSSVATVSRSDMKIYYNAALNLIRVESLDDANAIVDFQLVNLAGQVIKSVTDLTENSINVSGINSGLYIVIARTADGAIYSDKVVINK